MKITYTVSHGANSRGPNFVADNAKGAAVWASLLEEWGRIPTVTITKGGRKITIDGIDTDGEWTPSAINSFARLL